MEGTEVDTSQNQSIDFSVRILSKYGISTRSKLHINSEMISWRVFPSVLGCELDFLKEIRKDDDSELCFLLVFSDYEIRIETSRQEDYDEIVTLLQHNMENFVIRYNL